MENSNCSIWRSGSQNVSTIVVHIRSLGSLRQCSSRFVTLVDLDHHSFPVVPICLDGSAWWQSQADIVLEVLLCHVRSGHCQAVEGWRVILGIQPILAPRKNLNIPNVVPQSWNLVDMHLAKSSTMSCSSPRTKHAMGADQDLITMRLYPVRINKRMNSLHFSSFKSALLRHMTVVQQHFRWLASRIRGCPYMPVS